MNPRIRFTFSLVALVLIMDGCTSVSNVQRMALAGSTYGSAMDNLLRVTQKDAVNADSERMLSQGHGSAVTPNDRKRIYDKHQGVTDVVAEIERLRQHFKLLQRYFDALNALATTNAPARAQNSAQGTAETLNRLGNQLRSSPLLSTDAQNALARLTGLSVQAYQRRVVAKELKTRAALIERQMRIQQALLVEIRKKLQADRKSIATLGMQREVKRPYIDGDMYLDPLRAGRWIQTRRSYIIGQAGLDALTDAEGTADKLRKAWIVVVEGRLDELAFQDLLTDIETLMAVAEMARPLY